VLNWHFAIYNKLRLSKLVTEFEPVNELERCLVKAQRSEVPSEAFMALLWKSQVVMLIDKDPGPSGKWDNTASPLVLTNQSNNPVMALFTSPERSTAWAKQVPQFCFGMQTDFNWLIRGVSPGVGIVVNPGLPFGLEITAERVQEMRAADQ
jgi:hypothetical protein